MGGSSSFCFSVKFSHTLFWDCSTGNIFQTAFLGSLWHSISWLLDWCLMNRWTLLVLELSSDGTSLSRSRVYNCCSECVKTFKCLVLESKTTPFFTCSITLYQLLIAYWSADCFRNCWVQGDIFKYLVWSETQNDKVKSQANICHFCLKKSDYWLLLVKKVLFDYQNSFLSYFIN